MHRVRRSLGAAGDRGPGVLTDRDWYHGRVMARALLLPFCILLAHAVFAQEAAEPLRPAEQPTRETINTQTLLVQVLTELAELRHSIDRLERTMEVFIEEVVADLRAENARSRATAGVVPAPIADAPPLQLDAIPRDLPLDTPEFGYTVVKEWGRSPEMAASFPTEVSTLKGMVLLVPPGITDEALTRLGEELREQYSDYDNINIEVFDEPMSAQTFADTGVAKNPERRVLTVSKYRASGRDLILLIQGNTVIVVDDED